MQILHRAVNKVRGGYARRGFAASIARRVAIGLKPHLPTVRDECHVIGIWCGPSTGMCPCLNTGRPIANDHGRGSGIERPLRNHFRSGAYINFKFTTSYFGVGISGLCYPSSPPQILRARGVVYLGSRGLVCKRRDRIARRDGAVIRPMCKRRIPVTARLPVS